MPVIMVSACIAPLLTPFDKKLCIESVRVAYEYRRQHAPPSCCLTPYSIPCYLALPSTHFSSFRPCLSKRESLCCDGGVVLCYAMLCCVLCSLFSVLYCSVLCCVVLCCGVPLSPQADLHASSLFIHMLRYTRSRRESA